MGKTIKTKKVIMKHSLLSKVTIRFLKEKNMFCKIKPYLTEETLKITEQNKIYDNVLFCLGMNMFLIPEKKFSFEFMRFFENDDNNKEFNSLLTVFCKKEIKNFILKEEYKNILFDNLYMKNFELNLDNKISSSDYNKLFNNAIDKMINNNLSPLSFILSTFDWRKGDIFFWLKIHREFENYLWDFLNKQL